MKIGESDYEKNMGCQIMKERKYCEYNYEKDNL